MYIAIPLEISFRRNCFLEVNGFAIRDMGRVSVLMCREFLETVVKEC